MAGVLLEAGRQDRGPLVAVVKLDEERRPILVEAALKR